MENRFIVNRLTSSVGSDESSSVELIADTKTGEAYLEVKKTIIETFPLTDYQKAMKLHENINRGGGRRKWKLEDFTK